ncbi:MAG: PA14 domain-containing protein, partial [Steroidobacteraceae bacterium]
SAGNNPQNIGTLSADSGSRLGGPLAGIDIPTLRDVWATAPYLHRGSAPTIADAIQAHNGFTATATELANLAAYVAAIGNQEATAPGPGTPGGGGGLAGQYFNNLTLAGNPSLQRVEAVDFNWALGSPGAGVSNNNFSVRWSGHVEASATGSFRFQTQSNDGVRLWVNGVLVIDNWVSHSTINDNSSAISLIGGTRYSVTMEYYDRSGAAVARLRWRAPGQSSYAAIPASRLFAD